ncbi:Protein of unknown function DUF3527 [Dillenia turbinata]|uniref:Uncharacterized protein n=1 Tax=Dillenia turbinata TaxID=194707 RepID=A0AAN8WG48_9MAGN
MHMHFILGMQVNIKISLSLSMGLDMEPEFDKYCEVIANPKFDSPSQRHSYCRNSNRQSTSKSQLSSIGEDFAEISFNHFRSTSSKTLSSRSSGLDDNVELKRGSMYQSSKTMRKMKRMGSNEGRSKIELTHRSSTFSSFNIIESLCDSDEESLKGYEKKFPVISINSNSDCSEGFLDLSFSQVSVAARDITSRSVNDVVKANNSEDTVKTLVFQFDQVIGPQNDGNDLLDRDAVLTLNKSLSTKLRMPHSPTGSQSYLSTSSPRVRLSPIRKMLDPLMKSKSMRSSSVSVTEPSNVHRTGLGGMRRKRTLCKSLLNDFANTAQKVETITQTVKRDDECSVLASSPAQLHGYLKLEVKQGVPFFEFSVNSLEDIFVAKTWKADNAFQWVYTFHSIHNRKKYTAGRLCSKDCYKESSMVGQMQVSCYLCAELKDGVFDNSMVTEFVLYDIAHSRKGGLQQETTNASTELINPPKCNNSTWMKEPVDANDASDLVKLKNQAKSGSGTNIGRNCSSIPYPWAPADLQPNLEIAAIVIQVPFERRKGLKYKADDNIGDKVHQNKVNVSTVEKKKEDLSTSMSPTRLKVVTPIGTHSLPSSESRGPSTLLNRWRLGGGCDCGGWDMACPLIVFDNPEIRSIEDQLMEERQPLQLFVQGAKENVPALTVTVVEEGQYIVDFHAQLSTLQAFSICIAMLHSTVASNSMEQKKSKRLLPCDSLNMLLKEEMEFIVGAVTEEEKRKLAPTGKDIPPPFILNPPFSPLARL